MKSKASSEARELIDICAEKKLLLVLTFPSATASNGLSVEDFLAHGLKKFSSMEVHEVRSDFSTLGGNKKHRAARQECGEAIATFVP